MPEKKYDKKTFIIKLISFIFGILLLISAVVVMFINPKEDFYIILSIALFIIGVIFTSFAVPIRMKDHNDNKPIK